jgi:hypothetical protein
MYVYDLALGLQSMGYTPICFTPRRGDLARAMELRGISVIDDLQTMAQSPDLIHGNHTLETLAAAMRFPKVPALYVCHDSTTWHDTAPHLPNIVQYVGVDEACCDRIINGGRIPPERVRQISNGVDTTRFPIRTALPQSPTSILLFGYQFGKSRIELLRRVSGLHVEAIGVGSKTGYVTSPATILSQFDIVFARGRSAREAIATGAATIVADSERIGGMVSSSNYDLFERNNFGRRLLELPWNPAVLQAEIAKYSASESLRVAKRHVDRTNQAGKIDELLELYQSISEEWDPSKFSPDLYFEQASKWLSWATLNANGARARTSSKGSIFKKLSRFLKKVNVAMRPANAR